MNYFELFEIPVSLRINKASLPKKYFELSRKYHPDFFANAPAAEQAEMLEISSMVNKAYKTLQHPDELVKYVLQLKGLLQEEEKYDLAPDFLMEVMDINEELMELEPGTEPSRLNDLELRITQLENDMYEPVKAIVEHYQEGVTSPQELLQVKEYYFRKKYLHRILDKIAAMRNIAPHS
jgi:molecular chaperone HscB